MRRLTLARSSAVAALRADGDAFDDHAASHASKSRFCMLMSSAMGVIDRAAWGTGEISLRGAKLVTCLSAITVRVFYLAASMEPPDARNRRILIE